MSSGPKVVQQSLLLEWRTKPEAPAPREKKPPEEKKPPPPVSRPPAAPPSASDEAPWWQRARMIEQQRAEAPSVDWGTAWRGLMRDEGWTNPLGAGQRALLEHMVRALDVREGVIEGSVVPSRAKPQRVQVRLPAFTTSEWARVARQIVDDGGAESVAAVLASDRIPMSLLVAADQHQLRLLPRRLRQLAAACTCGGARLPCDHVIAVHLAFSKRLDARPQTLLEVRGCHRDGFLKLVDRVLEEAAGLERAAALVAPGEDPFARREGPEPDWSLLDGPASPRAPLPSPDGWRGRETFDALVRRLLSGYAARP